jgi:hypothetical protein
MTYEWRPEKTKQVYARCTFEGGCECLEDEGEPAIEDCVNCPSFEWGDQEDNGGEEKENVGRKV